MKTVIKQISLLILAVICIASLLILGACNANSNNTSGKTITDSYGRKIDVPENVKAIAVVGSAARYCVYAGAQDKLIAVTDVEKESNLRPYTIAYKDLFSALPSTNNGNHLNNTNVDEEKLLSLKPDVILSSRSAQECSNLQNDINIPVVGIYSQDQLFDDSVIKSIEIVGNVASTQEKTKQTIDFLRSTNKELSQKCPGNQTPVYRGAVNYKGSKDLCGTVSDYCIYDNLKINNVAKNPNITEPYDTSLEQILTWNPSYIFMDCTNKNKVKNQKDQNPEVFNNVDAFKNDNAHFVAPFNNNGTNIEYGLCEAYYTAKIIYPENFSDINLDEKFQQIFEKMDGKDIYKTLIESGIYFGKANF